MIEEHLNNLLATPFEQNSNSETEFLKIINSSYTHHFNNCHSYKNYCEKKGYTGETKFTNLSDIPFLPVQIFKENPDLLCSVPRKSIKTKLSSSATSGTPSTILIDKVTSKRQIKALASVLSSVLGPKRRPFIVFDVDPNKNNGVDLGARNAAVRGFINLAREANYVLYYDKNSKINIDIEYFTESLKLFSSKDEPVCLFGFTFVLYEYAIKYLHNKNTNYKLPKGSKLIHIGGWKKLKDKKISKNEFDHKISNLFGLTTDSIIDFYGFTEQMGVVYPDGLNGNKRVPSFADVLVRDPVTFNILNDGEQGLLQFITPIPNSYPGHSVLTDDVGIVKKRRNFKKNIHFTEFEIIGRAKKAEPRGCGDIMGEKISINTSSHPTKKINSTLQKPKLLFDENKNYCPPSIFEENNITKLPEIHDLKKLINRLSDNRKILDKYSIDELILLIDSAASKWMEDESNLIHLRAQGLQFLSNWCKGDTLRTIADESLRGRRGYIDNPRGHSYLHTNRRLLYARPRGIVSHWLAGNVPLLGMLTLAQSIITKNSNILKAASSFSSVLPALLETFRDLEVISPAGRIIKGNDVLKTIAVIYYDRSDVTSAHIMSELSNCRISWGGKEAIKNTISLPKDINCEDIIFGPKLSYMVIGEEILKNERLSKKYARRAATDISVFDQYACASPHTIFLENPEHNNNAKRFASLLSQELDKALIRIPKGKIDQAIASQIESVRLRYELVGDVWKSNNTDWTILYNDSSEAKLANPIYSRVITLVSVKDIMLTAELAHTGIQTIGLGLDGDKKLMYAKIASNKGAQRFPDIGRMTNFDTPWDGLYPMDRLVKWISIGGPF